MLSKFFNYNFGRELSFRSRTSDAIFFSTLILKLRLAGVMAGFLEGERIIFNKVNYRIAYSIILLNYSVFLLNLWIPTLILSFFIIFFFCISTGPTCSTSSSSSISLSFSDIGFEFLLNFSTWVL